MSFLGVTRHFPIVLKENTQRSLHRCLAENMDLFHPLLWPEWLARGLFKSQAPQGNWGSPENLEAIPTDHNQAHTAQTFQNFVVLDTSLRRSESWGGTADSSTEGLQKVWDLSHSVWNLSQRGCACVCVVVVILCQTSTHSKFGVTPNAQRIEMIGARPEISMSTGARNRLWAKERPKTDGLANKTAYASTYSLFAY